MTDRKIYKAKRLLVSPNGNQIDRDKIIRELCINTTLRTELLSFLQQFNINKHRELLNSTITRSKDPDGDTSRLTISAYLPSDIVSITAYWQAHPNGINVGVEFVRDQYCKPDHGVRVIKLDSSCNPLIKNLDIQLIRLESHTDKPCASFKNIPIPVGSKVQCSQVNLPNGNFQISIRWFN